MLLTHQPLPLIKGHNPQPGDLTCVTALLRALLADAVLARGSTSQSTPTETCGEAERSGVESRLVEVERG